MTSYKAMELFAAQLRRLSDGTTFKTKVVLTPSSIKESGVIYKISLVKTWLDGSAPAAKNIRHVKLRLAVCGTIESMTGLEQATEAIEKLDDYFIISNQRLEEIVTGENSMEAVRRIPNTRFSQTISQEDSFVDVPDSTEVQDVEDVRYITLTVPAGDDGD